MAADSLDDVRYFNDWSESYERSIGQGFFGLVHRLVLDQAARYIGDGPPRSVLDVGCATGRLLRAAARRWPSARLTGVDPAEGMIAVARGLAPERTFLVGTAESLPLPDASVDVAFSTISFHHWADQDAGIREVARVLRPGGVFCLADVNVPYPLSIAFRHFGSFHPRGFRALFERAGLSVASQSRRLLRLVLVTVGTRR